MTLYKEILKLILYIDLEDDEDGWNYFDLKNLDMLIFGTDLSLPCA